MRGSSNSGTVTTRMTIAAGLIIAPRGHFLATNANGYSGAVPGDQSYTSGFANDGGIAITLPNDQIVDQVGLSSGSAFVEGTHLAPLPSDANQSYERKPGGFAGSTQDTHNNLSDFHLVTPSDPQNLSSPPTPGSSPGPSPDPSPSASPSPSPSPSPSASPSNPPVVISQVYGGGGNSGAPFRNDFVELLNRGTEPVTLSGWSLQYASANGATWSVLALPDVQLAPGQYFLIQLASGGSNGAALPAPDATGTTAMAATAGKVILLRNATQLSGGCPVSANLVDLVGYGSTASCFRGLAPASAPSNTLAALRGGAGCTDTMNNAADFAVGPPIPRNRSAPIAHCVSQAKIAPPFSLLDWPDIDDLGPKSLEVSIVPLVDLNFSRCPRSPKPAQRFAITLALPSSARDRGT